MQSGSSYSRWNKPTSDGRTDVVQPIFVETIKLNLAFSLVTTVCETQGLSWLSTIFSFPIELYILLCPSSPAKAEFLDVVLSIVQESKVAQAAVLL